MTKSYTYGNAATDELGDESGWFVGHFMREQDSLRHSSEVELKWARHRAGEQRSSWVMNHEATTISVLIHGLFQISFAEADVLLSKAGDYVIWGPRVPHTWVAEEDSTLLTIRWPSHPHDGIDVADPRASMLANSLPERAPSPSPHGLASPDTGA